jgi:hypothetical protein
MAKNKVKMEQMNINLYLIGDTITQKRIIADFKM